ncbi:uncharacterized protein LOC109717709 [Ananas comosus]|uniref:Uncharacterized protein LOC109717709 n=2 Tax=Ananas comosus TaxID=4615 RepID=A0A6P5G1M7_ANACO|nr:uncharacterized protein LOC109717709 [Ananas comosus]XP_020099175.1 uncharacterized protein LOC109717709 [Ananas comosus]
MGRKQEKRRSLATNQGMSHGLTLREENTGKKTVDVTSILRIQHLKRLATWASGEARIPPLGALLGERLAANAEASGVPLDSSTFLCQRCETVLQPGFNCTVRIKKKPNKPRRRKKSRIPSQNNVIYTCHFCSHPNIRWGTPKGHLKSLSAPRSSSQSDSKRDQSSIKELTDKKAESISELNHITPEKVKAVEEVALKHPTTPLVRPVNMPDNKQKGSASASEKLLRNDVNSSSRPDSEKRAGGSSKRRRKGWSSLKEITENNELQCARSINNFVIPFVM